MSGISFLYREYGTRSITDYYPFGMEMVGRSWSIGEYRFGYQGSEKDNDIKGDGNNYTTLFRELDVRLGRWFAIDPETTQSPWESPYVSMGDNPILLKDPLGDLDDNYETDEKTGKTTVKRTTDNTNTYTYKKSDGEKVDLGTFKVVKSDGRDLVEIPKTGIAYEKALQNDANYLPEDGFASFLGATYSYYTQTGYKSKVNQFMTNDRKHSPSKDKKQHDKTIIDVQYIGIKDLPNSTQANTSLGTADADKSNNLAKNFRFFGFNNEGKYNVFSQAKDPTKPFLKNSAVDYPHQNHIHFQALIKALEVK